MFDLKYSMRGDYKCGLSDCTLLAKWLLAVSTFTYNSLVGCNYIQDFVPNDSLCGVYAAYYAS